MRKATLTVSGSMSDETYSLLENGIKKKFGEDIAVTRLVDETLIGGFVLSVDGVIYDNSVISQLDRIKKELI